MFPHWFRVTALFLAGCVSAAAQTYHWTAFAGLPPQAGSADGVGSNARFDTPFNLIADNAGNVYVTDTFNHTIRRISPNGAVTTLAGQAEISGAADGIGAGARFFFPAGITLARGTLFVTDRGNHTIRRVTTSGTVTLYAGSPGVASFANGSVANARFDQPSSITADAAENLYVVDTNNHVIRKITPEGGVSSFAGSAGNPGSVDSFGVNARFRNPESITIDNAGFLYVADRGNHTIRKISPGGEVTTVAGLAGTSGAVNGTGAAARFRSPSGVLAYGNGALIVIDTGNSCLRSVTPDGVVTLLAGRLNVEGYRNGPRTDARFFQPSGAAFTAGGIVVADTLNHSIRKLESDTFDTSTLAGGGGNFGKLDGFGPAARFNFPNGVAVHSSGDVYLADTRGNSIRRISPDGLVVRVAGAESGDVYRDGTADVASLNYPFGLTLAPDRTIYFCENQMHTIRRVNPDGSVETVAGSVGAAGAADGSGTAARFNFPGGIVRDHEGNLFIADTSNHTIRRIAAGTTNVTTFAGSALNLGSADGTGSAARFHFPRGVAVDAQGNLYVADSWNHTIRKITREGVVTTIAGSAGVSGSANGSTTAARFQFPLGVAVDAGGQIFVADTLNATVRLIKDNTVSTIGGSVGLQAFAEGTGSSAMFFTPNSIAVDNTGNLYISQSGSNLVGKGTPLTAPSIATQPQAVTTPAGGTATFTVAAGGGGLLYQWRLNGVAIPGATGATYTITGVTDAHAGSYSVTITNTFGAITSQNATLLVTAASNAGRIINLSILSAVDSPGDTYTMGFVVGGSGTTGAKPLVIRAAGPSLAVFQVPGVIADPRFDLFFGTTPAGGNDNWGGSTALATAMANVGAFEYIGADSRDAAFVGSFASGDNSVRVAGVGNATGAVISEIYDATPSANFTIATPRLLNVSVLKHLGSGLTAGFSLGGATPKNILIRAIGPTLTTAFGVGGTVANPEMILYSGTTPIGNNDDWGGGSILVSAFTQVGAFELPNDSKDAALAVTLNPGNYTVQVKGKDNTTGIALVEIYELP